MKLIKKNRFILVGLFLFASCVTSKDRFLENKDKEIDLIKKEDQAKTFFPGINDSESFFLSDAFLTESNEYFKKAREFYAKSNLSIASFYLDKIMLEDDHEKDLLFKTALFLAYIYYELHEYKLSEYYFDYFLNNYKYSHASLRVSELRYFNNKKKDALSSFKDINKNSIFVDYDKGIYNFLSDRLGIKYLNLKSLGFIDNSVFDIYIFNDDLFITNIFGGLLKYNIKNNSYRVYIKDEKSIFLNGIKGFAIKDNIVYIGGKNVIYYLDDLDSYIKVIKTPKNANFKSIEVLFSLGSGLLVGTLDSGLWLYSDNEWKKISIGTNRISCIFSNKEDDFILVGSLDKAIYKISKNNFFDVSHVDFFSNEKSGKNITFIKKYKENYYVGTYGGGLFELDLVNDSYKKLEPKNQNIGYFLDMKVKDDKLFFATFNYGLLIFNKIKNEWNSLGPEDGVLSLNLIKVLIYDNYIILGTLNNGLIFVNEDIKKKL